MSYSNFATHYRPTTFAEVVGQEVPKSVLKKIALAPGISVRSVFLKGSYGSGKSTLARIFARALNCEHFKETGDVCNTCDGCRDVLAPNSNLYYELDASVAGNVETIRALHEKLSFLPRGRRLVVMDEVHACSNSALNALLKLVEDGVPDTMFLFASTEDILPTLKSRSVCLDITTIPHQLIVDRITQVAQKENIEISPQVVNLIASKSAGHMRDALSYLQLYSLSGPEALESCYPIMVKFFKAAFTKNFESANKFLETMLSHPSVDVVNSLNLFLKDCFVNPESQFTAVANKLFGFFFSPVAQAALKDEVGIELTFRSFLSKVAK